jgi:hypothetical protein
MIEEIMLDPEKLKECMDFFKETTRAAHLKLTQDLRAIDRHMQDADEAKHRIVDVYASGDLERDAYVERSLAYDQELNALRRQRSELIKKIPLLHKAEAVDVSITQYCSAANVRFRNCVDFPSKRQFLLDHIDKVVFSNDSSSQASAGAAF